MGYDEIDNDPIEEDADLLDDGEETVVCAHDRPTCDRLCTCGHRCDAHPLGSACIALTCACTGFKESV